MEALKPKQIDQSNYRLHFLRTKKFKTNTIALKFSSPLDRKTITERALLPFIMQKGTENYPSELELRLKLDEMYGAKFSINSGKKGENHVITVVLDFANDQFIPEEDQLVKKAISFLYEVVANPKINDNSFDPTIVEREKETLKNKIQSIIDEKMQYANMRLIDNMCENEKFGIHSHGYLEDLPNVNGSTLVETYQSMLNNDSLDIFVVGDFNEDDVNEQFINTFTMNRTPRQESFSSDHKEVSEVNEVVEEQKLQQAKLHLGFRTMTTFKDEDYRALQVFNGIFGGYPHSKLFMNVREKHSLAYYAASRIESNKGLLFVFSGIAPDQYDLAKKIIIEQFEDMKAGKITDEELEQTKKAIIHQVKETIDRAGGMVEWFYQQSIGGSEKSIETVFDEINQVTIEDIVKMANKVQLDTVYLLTATGGEKDE
ncbi:peptidase M16 [Halalkalibacillus sediminis]|uniref:Peptidase M16 n=1 Tax=Halalkalibacillus sediminis TaxID=2018042 RepID=A0A2I0QWH3_9BACI|nr:pitrilysin family protein [Halalkalibacillus sediminis]PKR78682.1 peptidase M16 [Halalkalibacillus sediminis]